MFRLENSPFENSRLRPNWVTCDSSGELPLTTIRRPSVRCFQGKVPGTSRSAHASRRARPGPACDARSFLIASMRASIAGDLVFQLFLLGHHDLELCCDLLSVRQAGVRPRSLPFASADDVPADDGGKQNEDRRWTSGQSREAGL